MKITLPLSTKMTFLLFFSYKTFLKFQSDTDSYPMKTKQWSEGQIIVCVQISKQLSLQHKYESIHSSKCR